MKLKKLESGRSMVEMLGVLAIIGVLSVGGIAGYSLSMRRHRANQIVDIATKYALVGYSQYQQKVLNGEIIPSGYNSINVSFESAGVGETPAGLASPMGFLGVRANSTNGSDYAIVNISFNDEKLCQTVASIIGTGWSSGGCWRLPVSFKQN